MSDLEAIARELITGSKYMVLGTADADGTPWVTPVFYTPDGYSDFYWVSSPDARHSRNIEARPSASIAIFDSHVPIGKAEAVYMAAQAAQVPDDELEAAAATFNSRLPADKQIGAGELQGPTPFRLYRATVTEHSVLIRGGDPRNDRGADDRLIVTL
ncbi:pyridoxamine 5'-phosphate oxidase family protein [Kribbella deserti]|uniref:Pyridoxamine 5'-phosphate oxidase family protein n=1 Tax=Kribbella deserti TaxID=1926257 RepID=A0ABV6QDC3_9ACTN